MATRSTIALEYADGTVDQIYCHFDGYLENNGQLLQTHWQDPFKVRNLMELGDLSWLGKEIGRKQDFDAGQARNRDWCLAYGRDRGKDDTHVIALLDCGESLAYGRDRGEDDTAARRYSNFQEYLDEAQREEYNYCLRQVNGQPVWYVQYDATDDRFVTLERALDRLAVEALK